MSQELAIKQLHNEGASADEICHVLSLPLAVVDEALDGSFSDDNLNESIALPIIEDLELKSKDEIHIAIMKYSNFLANQTIVNLNKPDALNSLGKASVILNNVTATLEKLKDGTDKKDDNKFTKYLKD